MTRSIVKARAESDYATVFGNLEVGKRRGNNPQH